MLQFVEWVADLADGVLGVTGEMFVGQSNFSRSFQLNTYTCAPRCVYMVLRHFGVAANFNAIERGLKTDRNGTTPGNILRYLRKRGFVTRAENMTLPRLAEVLTVEDQVVIAYVDNDHVAVVYGMDEDSVYIADPSLARSLRHKISRARFRARWDRAGIVVRPR